MCERDSFFLLCHNWIFYKGHPHATVLKCHNNCLNWRKKLGAQHPWVKYLWHLLCYTFNLSCLLGLGDCLLFHWGWLLLGFKDHSLNQNLYPVMILESRDITGLFTPLEMVKVFLVENQKMRDELGSNANTCLDHQRCTEWNTNWGQQTLCNTNNFIFAGVLSPPSDVWLILVWQCHT